MELTELYNIIKDELIAAGFTKRPSCCKEEHQSAWTYADELTLEEEAPGFCTLNGYTLDVYPVYHSNGATRNISYRLCADKWNHSTGGWVEMIKISTTQTEKTLRKKIKEFIKTYLQIINNVI